MNTLESSNYAGLAGKTIWFTGLSSSGKSKLVKEIEKELRSNSQLKIYRLDGDELRKRGGINEYLGFSPEDRRENLRVAAHLAKMRNEENYTVLAGFITPEISMGRMIRDIISPENFKLIYVHCPLHVCEKRDKQNGKGLYAKARRGEIPDFTGISAPFEHPQNPYMIIDTHKYGLEECVSQILEKLI